MNGHTRSMEKLKYIAKRKDRKGGALYYYRRSGNFIRIPYDIDDSKFFQRYSEIHAGFEKKSSDESTKPFSLRSLIIAYKKSSEFKKLEDSTKREYLRVLDRELIPYYNLDMRTAPRSFLMSLRDKHQETPSRANKIVSTTKTLFSYGVDLEWITSNPFTGVKRLSLKGEGALPWTARDIDIFREKARPHMRLLFELGLNTGQRLQDCMSFRWSDFKNGDLHLTQKKTKKKMIIPCNQTLKDALKSATKRSVYIVTNQSGNPYIRGDSLSSRFVEEAKKCNLIGLSFHGLRKSAAIILAESGCNPNQIMAVTGHDSMGMVEHYTKGLDQRNTAAKVVQFLESGKQ